MNATPQYLRAAYQAVEPHDRSRVLDLWSPVDFAEALLERAARDKRAVADLIEKVRYLLEWMPICSIGSSGHLRRVDVEQAIAKLEGRTGRNMILAPLPAGVEDTPEVRRRLQAYVDGDQPAAKDKGTGWGGMHDPLPDSARSASAYDHQDYPSRASPHRLD